MLLRRGAFSCGSFFLSLSSSTFFPLFYLLALPGASLGRNEPLPPRPMDLRISSGQIRGEVLERGTARVLFQVFKGIPFAAAPQGDLRFKKPAPMADWRGVMNATEFSAACYQRSIDRQKTFGFFRNGRISENCLFLNVFAPVPVNNETYPIIVFIHGGNFQHGASSDYLQDPILDNFVSKYVVFITFNYRLGPFGFLATGDKVVPGNNGLWDIVEVLKWVQKNGDRFGGDISQVTLMGHGSGAGTAGLIALSKQNTDLVHRVIMMSGSPFTPGLVRKSAINATHRFGSDGGCLAGNSSTLVECLRMHEPNNLIRHVRVPMLNEYEEWTPVVEPFDDERIIGQGPEAMVQTGPSTSKPIPFLLGTTQDESALQLILLAKERFSITSIDTKDEAEYLVRNLTRHSEDFKNQILINEACYYQYIETLRHPNLSSHIFIHGLDQVKRGILDMHSEFLYHAPATRFSNAYSDLGLPVYLYSFDHRITWTTQTKADFRYAGAHHGLDLALLFGLKDVLSFVGPERNRVNKLDAKVVEVFSELLTNFARYGDPTPADSKTVNWTMYERSKMNYMSIKIDPEMQVGFHWHGVLFWNKYIFELDKVDIGNVAYISKLKKELGDYQLATWVLLSSSLFFFAILVGLACYCMRKDGDEDDL